jgi:hypothetical protein
MQCHGISINLARLETQDRHWLPVIVQNNTYLHTACLPELRMNLPRYICTNDTMPEASF